MILKTKLLLSLGTLGVVAGTSSGIYYLKNKDVSDEQSEQEPAGSVSALPPNADIRNDVGRNPLPDAANRGSDVLQAGQTPKPKGEEAPLAQQSGGTAQQDPKVET